MLAAEHQVSSIHALLLAGQRPLRIYRHTLLLWGGSAGLLCLLTDPVMRWMDLRVSWQVAICVFVILGAVFGLAACIDKRLTLRHARHNDLTVPFAQQQITKVWWLLVGIGVILTCGMTMNGGAILVYCFWIAIFGVGLFIHGAFSEELPEWVGVGMLLLGIMPIILRVPYQQTRWLAVCAFGIGLPVLSMMLDGGRRQHFLRRLLQSLLWLTTVVAPALALYHWQLPGDRASLERVPLLAATHLPAAGRYVLSLPAGTVVPLQVAIDGPLAGTGKHATLDLLLKSAIDVEMRDGKPTGYYQHDGTNWDTFKDAIWIHSMQFTGQLADGVAPQAGVHIEYTTDRSK